MSLIQILKSRFMEETGGEALPGGLPSAQAAAQTTAVEPVVAETVKEEKEETEQSMWNALMDDNEEDEVEASPVVSEKEPSVKPEAGTETVVPADTSGEPVSSTPVTSPEPEKAQEPKPEPVQEPSHQEPAQGPVAQTPEEQKALYEQMFNDLQNSYRLTDKDAEDLQVSPEKVMPRILAGVHMSIQQQVMQQVQQVMQQAVPYFIQKERKDREVVDTFYKRWPDLTKHQNEVNNFSGVWRQMNPKASLEEAVESIGKHVMIALGYPVTGTATAEPAPVVPAYTPAPPTVNQPATKRQLNQFEALAEELLEEDI